MDTQRSIQWHCAHFEGARLSFGRGLRGLGKKDLGEKLGLSGEKVGYYESGKLWPDVKTFAKMGKSLGVAPGFLSTAGAPIHEAVVGSAHFRANRRVSRRDRVAAINYGRLVLAIFEYLESLGIAFPNPALPKFEQPEFESDLESLASDFRASLNLGNGPITDLAALLENVGIRIIFLPEARARLDGFAAWIKGAPCIMVDSASAASRLQFDYAHELAHLLLDENNPDDDPLIERRANRFASSFLMPAEAFAADCPRFYGADNFLRLKKYWHVSIAAALYRGRQLGLIPENIYKSACIQRQSQGLRINEEGEFPRSTPSLLNQAIELASGDLRLGDLSDWLGLEQMETEKILATQHVGAAALARLRGPLRQARIFDFMDYKKD